MDNEINKDEHLPSRQDETSPAEDSVVEKTSLVETSSAESASLKKSHENLVKVERQVTLSEPRQMC